MTAAVTADVGFIGLGRMGAAMAARLQADGAVLHVHDRDAAAGAALVATRHASARAVADAAGTVFVSLPTPDVSLQVAAECAGARRLRSWVETSTVGASAIDRIAARLPGIDVVDAPVSGGPAAAAAGTLAVMVSGAAAAVGGVRPWLDRLGSVVVVGSRAGQAQTMKLANNMVAAANLAATCEALAFGVKAGLDPAAMVRVLDAGSGQSRATSTMVPQQMLSGDFAFGAPFALLLKDLELGLAAAAGAGVPTWMAQQAAQLWRLAAAQQSPQADVSNVIRLFEGWAGVEIAMRRSDGN